MAIHVRAVSKIGSNASQEEQKKSVDKMMKIIRNAFNEDNGISDKIEEHERYMKPSEKRRLRKKKERGRALYARRNNERT